MLHVPSCRSVLPSSTLTVLCMVLAQLSDSMTCANNGEQYLMALVVTVGPLKSPEWALRMSGWESSGRHHLLAVTTVYTGALSCNVVSRVPLYVGSCRSASVRQDKS